MFFPVEVQSYTVDRLTPAWVPGEGAEGEFTPLDFKNNI